MTEERKLAGVEQEGVEQEEAAPATELAEKLRLLAQSDPERAADMVAQLVSALDLATGGAFTGQLDQTSSPAG
jgi:flagellar biosynthesis/type III secretory pathway M-ring protein FliF/YscJ